MNYNEDKMSLVFYFLVERKEIASRLKRRTTKKETTIFEVFGDGRLNDSWIVHAFAFAITYDESA